MKLQNFQAQFSDMMNIYFNSLELVRCHDLQAIEAINAANKHESFETATPLAVQLNNICNFIDNSALSQTQKTSFEKTVLGRLSPPEKHLTGLLSEDDMQFKNLNDKIKTV